MRPDHAGAGARPARGRWGRRLDRRARGRANPPAPDGVPLDEVLPQRVRAARTTGLLSGPVDGGGRVLGDIRRVALYGVDVLGAAKRTERDHLDGLASTEDVVARRIDLAGQLGALAALHALGERAGLDVAVPARSAREASQWMLLAYLAGLMEHPSAQGAWGRASAFLDVYVERDLQSGALTEARAQEVVDDVVLVLGLVAALRPAADVVITLGGESDDGRAAVTRTCLRHLRSLTHLVAAPRPQVAVLWSTGLPVVFRSGCAAASLAGARVGFVSDDLVRASWGDDAAIIGPAWTAVRTGGQVRYGGVRVNVAKAVLYAVDGGRDELTGRQVGPLTTPVGGEVLVGGAVLERVEATLEWVAAAAVDDLVCTHAARDRDGDERLPMALSDAAVLRSLVCEVVGLAIAAESLAAIRHAQVRPVRSTDGLVVDAQVIGEVPRFGTDDDRADELAVWLLRTFMSALRRQQTYRGANHAQALVRPLPQDGRATGATFDGRGTQGPLSAVTGTAGQLVASLAKLPYAEAQAGLAFRCPVQVATLGGTADERSVALVDLLDSALRAGGVYGLVVLPQ